METLKRLLDQSREINEKLVSLVEHKLTKTPFVVVGLSSVLEKIMEANDALYVYLDDLGDESYQEIKTDLARKNLAIGSVLRDNIIFGNETVKEKDKQRLNDFINKCYNR